MRLCVGKKERFRGEAQALKSDIQDVLGISEVEHVNILQGYVLPDVETDRGVRGDGCERDSEALEMHLEDAVMKALVDPTVDAAFFMEAETPLEALLPAGHMGFAVAPLPGQFDQRADSAAQCIALLTLGHRPDVRTFRVYAFYGVQMTSEHLERIQAHLINPVEAHAIPLTATEADFQRADFRGPSLSGEGFRARTDGANGCGADMLPEVLRGFRHWNAQELEALRRDMGLAMSPEDLACIQTHFQEAAWRDPNVMEIKVLDTYWSDHCRHTTFNTVLERVDIEAGRFSEPISTAYRAYCEKRDTTRPETLMDMATVDARYLRKKGGLENLDVSDEINACSIQIEVDEDGKQVPWLLMFKNETHNHPTEIEPFGGAATCLGGAIRDPLSGRSYVYQSMRVTGAADPRVPVAHTLPGKLPQRVITRKAAEGFSAYGNQIGLCTGHVSEVYHPGFLAKRMEVGAVIGAAPLAHVRRECPLSGDVVLLIGGRTGRDGVGGATGSSKEHDETSLATCGAEVQKGNPPEERKLQRLFRNSEFSACVKRCNDFGAGGVSVAIGELADSIDIFLDRVPKKYEGLTAQEVALSESQERMAVVVSASELERVRALCDAENLEATHVATVTDTGMLRMFWSDQAALCLSRAFLDTNGAGARTAAYVKAPSEEGYFGQGAAGDAAMDDAVEVTADLTGRMSAHMGQLNICSQKGLVEQFDNTIGSGTVLMPFGGRYEETPSQTMVAKLPVKGGKTTTVSMMSAGYDPDLAMWSPFHGGVYAVTHAIAKIVASGGDYRRVRLSHQEYFERLGASAEKWGKPVAALLGASMAQSAFGTAAIGGKDSMSGTFNELNVPPTLIAFAVAHGHIGEIISSEFKRGDSGLYCVEVRRGSDAVPSFETLRRGYDAFLKAAQSGAVLSARAVGRGGLAAALFEMALGNRIGYEVDLTFDEALDPAYGSIVFEVTPDFESDAAKGIYGDDMRRIGCTRSGEGAPSMRFRDGAANFEGVRAAYKGALAGVFPESALEQGGREAASQEVASREAVPQGASGASQCPIQGRDTLQGGILNGLKARPRVFIPVFPGTNCEDDMAAAFERAGAVVETLVFRNGTPEAIRQSIEAFSKAIHRSQIVGIPGGFSAGDEPDGSGKFIAAVLRNPHIAQELMGLLHQRDGLMLGICNGFQALIKVGLLPYGTIGTVPETAPTLTHNRIGRHVARMASVRVHSVASPWMAGVSEGAVFKTPFSHGEGRFVADAETLKTLFEGGQVATRYADAHGVATMDPLYNINGSDGAVEGVFALNGRIFGKMGHVERIGTGLYQNIFGETDMGIFQSGVAYFG